MLERHRPVDDGHALVTDLDPRAVSQPYRGRVEGSHEEALTTRRRFQGCVARISRHGRRNSITVYTAGKEDAASAFAEIANFLYKITSASQLRVEQRLQLIIY